MAPRDFEILADDVIKHATCTLGRGEVRYQPKSGGEHKIRGVFDDRVSEVDPDTEVVVSSNVFTLGIRLADLPEKPQKGDKVIISEQTYRVIDSQEDGAPGVSVVLFLHKA